MGELSETSGVIDVESGSFKEWFGDSKVVDNNGAPMVVYHATDAETIDEFINPEIGFHFAGNGGLAVNAAIKGGKRNPRVERVYLSLQNPAILNNAPPNGWPVHRTLDALLEEGVIDQGEYNNAMDQYDEAEDGFDLSLGTDQEFASETASIVTGLLEGKGYDGIKYWNVFDSGHTSIEAIMSGEESDIKPDWSYIAFNSDQIKFAHKNAAIEEKFTSEFLEWFGESKAMGEDGHPLLLCHATTAEFDVFEASRVGRTEYPDTQVGEAYFFTTDRLTAATVADANSGGTVPGDIIFMDVYLRLDNPIQYDPNQWGDPDVIDTIKMARMIEMAKEQGRDGVIYRSRSMGDTYVVFSPNQIINVNSKALSLDIYVEHSQKKTAGRQSGQKTDFSP